MSIIMDNNNSKCRTCLKPQNSSELKPISALYSINECNDGVIQQSITIYEMLQFLIGGDSQQFLINHKEINKLCKNCMEKLICSYTFRKMCLNTEEILLNGDHDHNNTDDGTFKGADKPDGEDNYGENNGIDIETMGIIYDGLEECGEDDMDNNFENFKLTQKTFTKQNCVKVKNQTRCRPCNKTFMKLREYRTHYRRTHSARKLLCTFCGKFIATCVMTKHLISHTASTKDFLCTECGKSFTLNDHLQKHLRIHGDDKRYVCEHCGERFIHWNSKRSHIRTVHTGEMKYKCNVCDKRFAQSSNLFRHLRLHTGDRPHQCTYCDKKFLTTSELRNHLVVHTREKKEICTACNKSFGTKKALRTHMKTHTGERNYLCTICNKSFTQAHVLRTHLTTHPNSTIPPPGTLLSQKALLKQSQKMLLLNQ